MLRNIRMWKKTNRYKDIKYENINLIEYKIIDVRSKNEYRENHLNGSVNIPLSDIKQKIEKIVPNKDRKILLYCQSGLRSKKAIRILEKLGYNNLYNLNGGIENI